MKIEIGDKVQIIETGEVATVIDSCDTQGICEPFYALSIDNGYLAYDESKLKLIKNIKNN